jgi:hypothetical protein
MSGESSLKKQRTALVPAVSLQQNAPAQKRSTNTTLKHAESRRKRSANGTETSAIGSGTGSGNVPLPSAAPAPRPGPGPAPAPAPIWRAGVLGSYIPFQYENGVGTSLTYNGKNVQTQKKVQIGGRGGLFYVSSKTGNRVYLKDYQRRKCENSKLQYDSGVCSNGGVTQYVPAPAPAPTPTPTSAAATAAASRFLTSVANMENNGRSLSSYDRPYGGYVRKRQ